MAVKFTIPQAVEKVARTLADAGYEAYLVGGCVRDLLMGRDPKDWDVATNAKPEEIQGLFKNSVYENQFGTVGVKTESDDPRLRVVEVTTFRKEGKYTDQRHPDEISFAETIEEDLARRDFTINAMALRISTNAPANQQPEAQAMAGGRIGTKDTDTVVDPFKGKSDVGDRVVRAVGEPEKRFGEDALRLMRAVRLAAELDFSIDGSTRTAIGKRAASLAVIANERIRDELVKILMSERAAYGVILLEELALLEHILPELRTGIGVTQNLHHTYTVFEHNVKSLDYAAKKGYSLIVRLAALLHDIGKPRTKRGEGYHATFYNHEVAGERMARMALERLHFSNEVIDQVAHLIRHHMFYYDVGEVSAAGVRRFLRRVGPEYVDDLIKVREADRIGSGVPKAVPYKLRHFLFMIEKVKRDPLSPKMLVVKGNDVMRIASLEPGPRVGQILAVLLEDVLDDPKRNAKAYLEKRVVELNALPDEELTALAAKAHETKEGVEEKAEEELKGRFYVR